MYKTFQALLFTDEERTFAGDRRKLYILLKIYKYLTSATTTSYKMKYSLHDTFGNTEPTEEGLGANLKKVLQHREIRGRFDSVNDKLKELGIERIVLGTHSIDFEGEF